MESGAIGADLQECKKAGRKNRARLINTGKFGEFAELRRVKLAFCRIAKKKAPHRDAFHSELISN